MQNNNNTNILQSQDGVQSNTPTNSEGFVPHKAIVKLKPEAALAQIEENLLIKRINDSKPLLASELKQYVSFQALMEADGHKFQTSGNQVKCCCPFHPDRTPSFFIHEDDSKAKCWGCNWYGDIIKYEQDFHRIEFKEAWWRLNDFVRKSPRTGRKAKVTPKKVKTEEPVFTPQQLKERKKYAERLANEAWLANRVVDLRFEWYGEKWDPQVIRRLAKDGFLGWAGSLAFIYPRGTKYRDWPGRDFKWEADGNSLWRGELLAGAKHVYLTESETDAIALLHTDLEDENGTVIIAVSGASNFQAEWASLFNGKKVTIYFDNDEAGIKGANRTGLFLKPFVSELLIHLVGGAN